MTTPRSLFRALLLVSALPLAAAAQRDGDRIDTTLVLDRGGMVHIGAVSGEIRITGSDRRDVRIVAEIETGRFERSFSSGRIAVSTRSVGRRQSTARYDVSVPVGTRVSANTVSGRIEIRATRGEVVAHSTSGSIEVIGARERLEVNTVSGDLDLRDTEGRMRVDAVSADIDVDGASGDLTAETVSGTITVRQGRLTGLRASAVSGSITYDGTIDASGSYRLNTHSGNVTIAMPANVGATLALETFSGRIHSEFPLTMQPGETTGRGRRMEFTLGGGGARVSAGAFSGNITIRRRAAATDRE